VKLGSYARGVHLFLVEPRPIAFAHRGGAGEAPENALAAFEIALTLGYRYLETDVHLTRDGVLIAFLDEHLDRVTDRTGAIAELGIAEVEAANAGHAFSPDGGRTFPFRGCGVRVPRVEAILARWSDARVNIDPKSDACAGPLAALLDRVGAWERVCVGSFSDRRLRRIRAPAAGVRAPRWGLKRLRWPARPRRAASCVGLAPTASRHRSVEGRFQS
jgi:glycerophosphoryl diester phosphodiesterase